MKSETYSLLQLALGFMLLILMSPQASSQVHQEWVNCFNGRGFGNDSCVDVAVDSEGNCIVTGYGDQFPNPHAYDYDYVTIKYNPAGEMLWRADFNSGASFENSCGILIDDDDNIYIVGKRSSFSQHWVVVKYNSDGVELWNASYDNVTSALGGIHDQKLDQEGNIYVTGYNYPPSGSFGYDCITWKLDHEGEEQWVAYYSSGDGVSDRGYGLDVDAAENVYVTGHSSILGSYTDMFILKYDAEGDTIWRAIFPPESALFSAQGKDICIGADGNIYVTGHYNGPVDQKYMVLKYSPDGEFQWVTTFGHPPPNSNVMPKMVMDDACSVYLTAFTEAQIGEMDFLTVKVDSQGVIQWISTYDGPDHLDDRPVELVLDAENNVYVAGASDWDINQYACTTIKYDNDGNEQWVVFYPHSELVDGYTAGIALDDDGNVFITGGITGDERRQEDYCTIKYSQPANLDGVGVSLMTSHQRSLCKISPNPFNPTTVLSYKLQVA